MTDQPMLVLTNAPDMAAAQVLARSLVESRLAACVSIGPAVHSFYRWQGNIEQADEVTLTVKTVAARYGDVEAAIRAFHPYQVPEILAVPVSNGSAAYLAWIADATRRNLDA